MNNFIVCYGVAYIRGLTVYHTAESENNFYNNYSFVLLPYITSAIYVNKIDKISRSCELSNYTILVGGKILHKIATNFYYSQTSNIRFSLIGNKIIDHFFAYRRCSNYIFIIDLTPGFNGLGKDDCKTRRR